jgi:hypothetical protein
MHSDVDVQIVQPPEWLQTHRVRLGAHVPIAPDLVEMGLLKAECVRSDGLACGKRPPQSHAVSNGNT